MHMVARRWAGYIVRKHGFLPVRSYGFLRLRPTGSRRAPHSVFGQFGRFESRHSRESKTVRSRRGLFSGVRRIGILRTSQVRNSANFAFTAFSEARRFLGALACVWCHSAHTLP